MAGYVLWHYGNLLNLVKDMEDAIVEGQGRITAEKTREVLSPLIYQSALREQHGVMRRMEAYGLSHEEIARILGYSPNLVDEILDLNWNEQYRYACIKGLKSFSEYVC